jgi:hypothetical protein
MPRWNLNSNGGTGFAGTIVDEQRPASFRVLLSLFAGLSLLPGGCMFRQTSINRQQGQLLTEDRAEVDSTRRIYQASILAAGHPEGGPDGAFAPHGYYYGSNLGTGSQAEKNAFDNMDSAQRKLTVDQRQFDDYRSASGQSSVSGEQGSDH